MAYQNEDTLLVSLDTDILVLLFGAGQCLVYGSHGDATKLMLLSLQMLLTGRRRPGKKFENGCAERFSVIYAWATLGPSTLRPTDMGRAFRHHGWAGPPNEGVQAPMLLPRLECVWAHGALSRVVELLWQEGEASWRAALGKPEAMQRARQRCTGAPRAVDKSVGG